MRWLSRIKWVALAVISVAALFYYQDMFKYTAFLFNHPLEDMMHGWVVPFASLYAMWKNRREFRASAGYSSWLGALFVLFFLIAGWFGERGEQTRIGQLSFIGLVWAIPFAFWGYGVERLMRFPAGFLLFTVSLSSFVDFITIRLRLISVMSATGILKGFGFVVSRSGTAIFSHVPGKEFNVDVAEPCSGIRSLFAMMALTAAYAYFTQKGTWKKWVLFASSVPIAMVGNMVRIISICAVASWFGQDVATGYYHDYSGFVIYAVGMYLMFFLGEQLKKIDWKLPFTGLKFKRKMSNNPKSESNIRYRSIALVGGVTVLTLVMFAVEYMMPKPVKGTVTYIADDLPEQVGEFESDVPWFCQDPQCLAVAEQRELKKKIVDGVEGFVCPECGKLMDQKSLGENTILPKDTKILKRNYKADDGLIYSVSVVIQGNTRASLHRAEICLPSQGFVINDSRSVPLNLKKHSKPLFVRQINASRPLNGGRMPVRQDGQLVWFEKSDGSDNPADSKDGMSLVYWMESKDRECCSHLHRILIDVWDRSVHNRINRWVMVAVNLSSGLDSPESYERLEKFLSEFCPQTILKKKRSAENR